MTTPLDEIKKAMEVAAYVVYAQNGNVRLWSSKAYDMKAISQAVGGNLVPLVRESDALSRISALLQHIEALEADARNVLDTELGELACTGSDAPCEDALGRLRDALPAAIDAARRET